MSFQLSLIPLALEIFLAHDSIRFSEREMTNKIVVTKPVVELDGDEMTRIIWKKIREEVRIVVMKSAGCFAILNADGCYSSYLRTCN